MRVNTGRPVDYDSVLEKGTLYRKERNTQKYAELRTVMREDSRLAPRFLA